MHTHLLSSAHSLSSLRIDGKGGNATPAQPSNNENAESATQATERSLNTVSGVRVSLSYHSSSSSLTYAPPTAEVKPVSEPSQTQAATQILSFIELRLRDDLANGNSVDELASRLAAGWEGFQQGYSEAYEQLKDSGLLSEEVSAAIEMTFDQVRSGIVSLAEEFGIESPVAQELGVAEASNEITASQASSMHGTLLNKPADPLAGLLSDIQALGDSDLQILESLRQTQDLSLQAQASAEREYSFELRTQDGDRVTVRAFSSVQASYATDGAVAEGAVETGEGFAFEVSGDLDEDELKAINDLLGQVNKVANDFFNGDLGRAFDKALEIGYDASEIAHFSVKLSQSQSYEVSNTYTRINQLDGSEDRALPQGAKALNMVDIFQQVSLLKLISDQANVDLGQFEQLAELFAPTEARSDEALNRFANQKASFSDLLQAL